MINQIITIKTLPKKIKPFIIQSTTQSLNITGYKQINSCQKIPIIQIEKYTRIWVLYQEIYLNYIQ